MNEKARGKTISDPKTPTIMVVEPDVLARMSLADYLRDCGYRVISGGQAQDVFDILESGETLDIVLAVVDLPGGVDGFSLASQIRQAYPGIDVILPLGVAKAADKAGDLCEAGPQETSHHPQEVLHRINMLREQRRTSKQ